MPKVLVVEDDETTAMVLRELMRSVPCDFTEVKDGRMALDLIRKTRYDAILLDLMLPEMSGEELLGCLNEEANCKDLRIVINSTSANFKWTKDKLRTFTNLRLQILPRPADPDVIVSEMRKVLGILESA